MTILNIITSWTIDIQKKPPVLTVDFCDRRWQDFAHVMKAYSNNPISYSFNTNPLVFTAH